MFKLDIRKPFGRFLRLIPNIFKTFHAYYTILTQTNIANTKLGVIICKFLVGEGLFDGKCFGFNDLPLS